VTLPGAAQIRATRIRISRRSERLIAVCARVQQSISDPAPSLSETEADARLASLFAASGAGDSIP
jgi:hypothetical protein